MESVKSAQRVFEFLEYFAKVQRQVSVAELAKHYGYPNSSVSTVMRTMVSLGYLSYDTKLRTYLPTSRLLFLVEWVGTTLYDSEAVKAVMRDLSDATGETIILGVQSGLRVQYVQVIDATGPVRLHADPGSFRSIAKTAVGHVLLSRFDNDHVGRMIRRLNNEEPDPLKHADIGRLQTTLAAVREQGYAVSIGGVVPGAGGLAMFLPDSFGPTPLAVGIFSVEAVIEKNRDLYVELIHRTIAKHSGATSTGTVE
nr:helix-turn-helix domain-containing protein [uncultured Devosia sp.]